MILLEFEGVVVETGIGERGVRVTRERPDDDSSVAPVVSRLSVTIEEAKLLAKHLDHRVRITVSSLDPEDPRT